MNIEDLVKIIKDSIKDLKESGRVVQNSLEKVEDIYLVYLYELEIFELDLICYIIFI